MDRTRREGPSSGGSDGTQLFDPFEDPAPPYDPPPARPDPDATARYGLGESDVTRPVTPAPGPSPRPRNDDRTTMMPTGGLPPDDDFTKPMSPGGGGQRDMFPAGDRTEYLPPVPPGATRATASVPPAGGPAGGRTSVMPPTSGGPVRASASVPPAGGYGGGYGDDYGDDYGRGGGGYSGGGGGGYGGGYGDRDDDDYGPPPPRKGGGGRIALIVIGVILAIILVTALGVIAGTAFFGGAPQSQGTPPPTIAPTTAAPAPSSASPSTSPSGLGPKIISFSAPSRVDCSGGAETQVKLQWEVKNASKVEVRLDGNKVDEFPSDSPPEVNFPCDKVGHRYTIYAIADDGTKSKSRSVSVRPKVNNTDGGQTGNTDSNETGGTGGN